jgi:hypothetical protein
MLLRNDRPTTHSLRNCIGHDRGWRVAHAFGIHECAILGHTVLSEDLGAPQPTSKWGQAELLLLFSAFVHPLVHALDPYDSGSGIVGIRFVGC